MNIFKSFSLKWWQAAIFKWGVLTLGIAIGAYWPGFFGNYLPLLIAMSVLCLAYVTYVWSSAADR